MFFWLLYSKCTHCSNSFADIYKADSSSGRCGFASSCSQSSSSSAVNVQSLTKDLHSAEIITGLNPDHPALKTWKNSGESASDATSGGEEKEERSMPLLLTNECFESEEEEQGCASKEEGGKEGSGNSTSICDGAVNASYLIQHCNAVYVVDSPDYTSSRAQDSVKLKNVSGLSQDLLPPEGMPQKQSVSCATTTAQKGAVLVPFDSCTISHLNTWECEGARPKNATLKQNVSHVRITAKKESGVDQSDSYMSSESIKWEHLGARPRDRTPKGNSSLYSSSLLSSLVDLVPQQVGEPVVLGVDNAFLTRHSVDKPLCGSLYYNYAEMLAEDMDSMMNVIDSNQAKPYLGDCQAAAMSDPYYQPYSSAFPLPSEAYIGEDGFPLDCTFNGPLSDSSAKLQADSDEMSSNEEGLRSKENQDKIQDLLHKLDQLQAENIFYVDRCLNQEKEIAQLKENLTQIEEEKQGLESEVGRQLFLEDKNKRQSKLYQPFTEHCHEQIMPNAASGPYFHVTGLDGEQLDKAGPCNNSGIKYIYVGETLCTVSA